MREWHIEHMEKIVIKFVTGHQKVRLTGKKTE